jgi:hypothetical protein
VWWGWAEAREGKCLNCGLNLLNKGSFGEQNQCLWLTLELNPPSSEREV